MSCERFEELRLARAAGPLAPAEEAALTAHLGTCAACARFARELDALERELPAALREPAGDPEAAARRFLAEAPPRPGRTRRWALAAAALLLGGLLWVWVDAQLAAGPAAGVLLEGGAGGVEATLPDEGRFRLAPGARAQVLSLAPRALRLIEGRVECRVRPGSGPFQVHTQLGKVSVVGTEFSVALEGAGVNRKQGAALGSAMLVVGVATGVVLVEAADGRSQARVGPGQVALVDPAAGVSVHELAALKKDAAEATRLRGVESELASARERLTRAEAELATLRAAAPTARPGPAAPTEQEPVAEAAPGGSIEDQVRAVDWREAARALLANTLREEGKEPDPATLEAISRFRLAMARLARTLGVESAGGAFSDRRVAAAFLPEWIGAVAGELTPEQRKRLAEAVAAGTLDETGKVPDCYLGRMLAAARRAQRTEELLDRVLDPEQGRRWVEKTGDDPYFAAFLSISHSTYGGRTRDDLTARVSEHWVEAFKLDAGMLPLLRGRAAGYVADALALPAPAAGLPGRARRRAALDRRVRQLELQIAAEAALAAELPLDPEARKRVLRGSSRIVDVRLGD